MGRKRNRKHGKIDNLPEPLKEAVEQMLLANCTYSDIVDFLGQHSVAISPASVCRYAQSYHANVEVMKIATENFRRMTEEMDKVPDLDMGEAIARVTGHHLLNALTQLPEERISEVAVDKLLRESNAMVRVLALKKTSDATAEKKLLTGIEDVQQMVFNAMAAEDPDTYAKVVAFLDNKRREVSDDQ